MIPMIAIFSIIIILYIYFIYIYFQARLEKAQRSDVQPSKRLAYLGITGVQL